MLSRRVIVLVLAAVTADSLLTACHSRNPPAAVPTSVSTSSGDPPIQPVWKPASALTGHHVATRAFGVSSDGTVYATGSHFTTALPNEFIVFRSQSAGDTWEYAAPAPDDSLDHLVKVDGGILATGGTTLVSTDGGTSWQPQDTRTGAAIGRIAAVVNQHNWALARVPPACNPLQRLDDQLVLSADESGTVWHVRPFRGGPAGSVPTLSDVVSGPGQIVIVGALRYPPATALTGVMFTSSDGGATWAHEEVHPTEYVGFVLERVLRLPGGDLVGIALGQLGSANRYLFARRTGNAWTFTPIEDGFDISAIDFSSDSNGLIADQKGVTYWTDDGGTSWHAVTVAAGEFIWDAVFVGSTVALTGTHTGKIFKTVDAGRHWRLVFSP